MTVPRAVALTFDDGPDPVWTPAVLDALARARARATFFVIAPRAAAHPELLRRMLDEGHAVALHCEEHVRHSDLTEEEVRHDTATALDTLARLGVHPTFWRTPWGVMTDASRTVAAERGLRLVHWTADTEDWAGHSPQEMLDRVVCHLHDGAVVLAHDGIGPGSRRSDCRNTVELIDPLVWRARARTLVPRPLDPSWAAAA